MTNKVRVESYVRRGKLVKAYDRNKKQIDSIAKTVLTASAGLGISLAALKIARFKYKSGLSKSVELARKIAANTKPTFTNKERITFTVGGFATDSGKGGEVIAKQFNNILNTDEVIPFINKKFNTGVIKGKERSKEFIFDFIKKASTTLIRTVVKDGRNPDAVELAGQMIAYNKANPTKPINLIGHSAGGLINQEAANIASKAGVKNIRVVNIGTPYFGVWEDVVPTINISNKKDVISNSFKNMNRIDIKNATGHKLEEYDTPELYDVVNRFLNRNNKIDYSHPSNLIEFNNGIDKNVKVKSFLRKGKVVRAYQRKGKKRNNSDNLDTAKKAAKVIATGAVLTGLPIAAYIGLRARYRANFKYSAELAKKIAQGIKVKDIKDKKDNLTFTVGGFAGVFDDRAGKEMKLAMQGQLYHDKNNKNALKKLFDNHEIIPFENKTFDIKHPSGSTRDEKAAWKEAVDKLPKFKRYKELGKYAFTSAKRSIHKFVEAPLLRGYNPAAIDLAAEVYAHSIKYPNKQINLIGHSAGGMVTNEAAEILELMKVKSNVVNIGTPHFGLTRPRGITITSKNDMPYSLLPQTNKRIFNRVKGHGIADYLGTQKVESFNMKTDKKTGKRVIDTESVKWTQHGNGIDVLTSIKTYLNPPKP